MTHGCFLGRIVKHILGINLAWMKVVAALLSECKTNNAEKGNLHLRRHIRDHDMYKGDYYTLSPHLLFW